LNEPGRRKQSVVPPAVFAALFTTLAVLAAAWGLGMRLPLPVVAGSQPEPVATPVAPPPPEAPQPPVEKPRGEKPPAEKPPIPDASVAELTPASPAAGAPGPDAGAVAVADAGEVDAGATVAAEVDGGSPPVAAAPAQPPPPPVQRKPAPPNPRAAMQRALAVSQVRHGEAALEQGRADEALGSFRAALENEPTLAAAFRGLGMAYGMPGQDAQALQSYDRYLRLAPGAADAAEIRQSIRELKARAKVGAKQQ